VYCVLGGAVALLLAVTLLATVPLSPTPMPGESALQGGAVPAAYQPLIERAAGTCPGVTAPLLAAQLHAESGWNPRAVSPVGARGLAQFMPGTWTGEGRDGNGDGIRDPSDPADAIAAQAAFLCKLLAAVTASRLPGDPVDLALAAYNAGLGAVQRYRGIPPYTETQQYVRRIRALLPTYTAPSPAPPAADGGSGGWVQPMTGRITSGFGPRWGRLHAGIDIAAPIGTPVHAASTGRVIAAGPAGGYGQVVKLEHPGGVSTVYGHISRWTVSVGQAVRAGQVIALSGNEGRSTGPHLHFETRLDGQPVDPAAFYRRQGTSLTGS
jgi:murein DD-endopeptidase MepM/ murein hydrolase activator NlpD